MARKATADNVRADMQPANFRAAVQVIRTIKAKTDRISGINGEISKIHATVEGYKVNRKAGRIFLVLDKLEPDERSDILRSLNGLFDASGWDKTEEDLVDQAEETTNVLRLPTFSHGEKPAGDALGEALGDNPPTGDEIDQAMADDFEATAEELAAQKGRAESKAAKETKAAAPSAKAKPKKDPPPKASDPKPATGAAAIAAMNKAAKEPKPYTGDNSDLANPQGNA